LFPICFHLGLDSEEDAEAMKNISELHRRFGEVVADPQAANSPEDQWILYGSKVVATPEEQAMLASGTVYKRRDTGDTFYVVP